MITIKLPYTCDYKDFYLILEELRKEFNIIAKSSYNRFKDQLTEKDTRKYCKEKLNNISNLDSWLLQCAVLEGKAIFNKNKENKVIFGSKNNLVNYLKHKISKEEYLNKKLLPLSIQGEQTKQGNRKFCLDIIDNNSIVLKLKRDVRYILKLPKLRKNYKDLLFKLEELNNLKNGKTGYTYSVKLDNKNIYVSFEEFIGNENIISLNKERYIGIDLNPENIGLSIKEGEKIIFCEEVSFKNITDQILNLNKSSNSKDFRYLNNKLNSEIYNISKRIANLVKNYNCANVFTEQLSFKNSIVNKYNKIGNRKCKNLWKRNIFINNLKKRLNISNIKVYEINPCYSSFIGNLQYNYLDSINASLEIGRRGYEIIIKKNKNGFYPNILKLKEELKHQWKEMINLDNFKNWKELFLFIKNLKLRYRVSLNDLEKTISYKVLRLNSKKSHILLYDF